jgi:hypothetical protein
MIKLILNKQEETIMIIIKIIKEIIVIVMNLIIKKVKIIRLMIDN